MEVSMKRIITLFLSIVTTFSLIFTLFSCISSDKDSSEGNKDVNDTEAPRPELDLEIAKENLKSHGYEIRYTGIDQIHTPGEKLKLYAYDKNYRAVEILSIFEFADEDFAKLNYQREKDRLENEIKAMEKQVEYLQLVNDEYTERIDELYEESGVIIEGVVQDYDDELAYFQNKLDRQKEWVVGIDGCYVWYGYKEVIEASHSKKEYEALFIQGSDCPGIPAESEFEPWSIENTDSTQDENAPKDTTVTFMGTDYSGDYISSSVRIPGIRREHSYKGYNIRFNIDAESGELTAFEHIYDATKSLWINEDEALEAANALAQNYINLYSYEIEKTVYESEKSSYYTFTYYRKVEGLRAVDALTVKIDGFGRVCSFESFMLGSFDGVYAITIDKAKADAAIGDKVEEIAALPGHELTYEIEEVTAIKLSDGTQALYYEIIAKRIQENNGEQDISTCSLGLLYKEK